MQLLKNTIYVKTKNNNVNFIIHPYLGDIFVVGLNEILLIEKWINNGEIFCLNDDENKFLEQLKLKNFLVNNYSDEIAWEEKTLRVAREYHNKQLVSTKSAVFVLTYDCNFACPYCYEGEIEHKPSNVLTKEMVDRVFMLYNGSLEEIALYGGEPLLPKTRDIIEYIVSKAPNAIYSLTTNGFYVMEFRDLLSRIKINNIMITLDGSKERHNIKVMSDGEIVIVLKGGEEIEERL